ncbi:MAG: sigma-70 family RNA polymerase sigma factor [Phycisphaerales bacterium]|nr:MAG: sigma-70 family RNA polymerase sigma factor [Phycisphaerales bacterium]
MVVDNSGADIILWGPHDRQFGPARFQRLSAKSVADIAACVAKQRGAGNGWDEQTLFSALGKCASLAMRPCRGKPASAADRMAWSSRWSLIRNYIVEQNVGLAYTMAARFRCDEVEWDDLRSEALFALVRAVGGFDLQCGVRFSTYACNAIIHALIRAAKQASQYRARVRAEYDSLFERPAPADPWSELFVDRLNLALEENRANLTNREATVLSRRFPRDGNLKLSLAEVGKEIKLSKEGTRRVQEKALGKLRLVLEADSVLR